MSDTLPKMRKDPISGEWVIFAPEKTHTVIRNTNESDSLLTLSSFLPGFEYTTGSPLFSVASKGVSNADWCVRVFPARHPLLRVEEPSDMFGEGLYDVMSRMGAHEVIVETSRNIAHLDELTAEELLDVFVAYKARMQDLEKDQRVKSLILYKNRGEVAGGTLPGHYSELIAFPFIPPLLENELRNTMEYHRFKRRCVFCDVLRQEKEFGKRVVTENEEFVVLAPYASRFPFELVIMPKRHSCHFKNQSDEILFSLAIIYKTALFALRSLLDNPAWNMVLHTAPINSESDEERSIFHWHISIIPRIFSITGMSLGGGVFVNPVLPEEAAGALRKIIREYQ